MKKMYLRVINNCLQTYVVTIKYEIMNNSMDIQCAVITKFENGISCYVTYISWHALVSRI